MTKAYNFNNAAPSQSYELIPDKSVCHVRFALMAGTCGPDNVFVETKTGLLQLVLNVAVTEGQYVKRQLFHRLTMGAIEGVEMSKGQEQGVAISGTFIRSLLEAARGFAPSDESAEALAARQMDSLTELDGLEAWVEIGIDKAAEGSKYDDQNKIKYIINGKVPGKKGAQIPGGAQASLPMGAPATGRAPAPAAKPAAPAARKPAWAS